jgi:hypothetical protein
MGFYRKKPVTIEAIQLRWDTWNEMCEFAGVGSLSDGKPQGCWIDQAGKDHYGPIPPPDLSLDDARIGLAIPTLEGLMLASEGDWIIRGVQGELYPCKPDIFEQTYETGEAPARV